MNSITKNIMVVLGGFTSVMGVTITILSLLKENYIPAVIASVFMLAGMIVIAIAFGDYHDPTL